MEYLIIVASLGRVRPLKFRNAGDDPALKAHLTEDPNRIVEFSPEHLSTVTTDQSGRFGRSSPPDRQTGMSYGEGNHLEAELEANALNDVRTAIANIVAEEGYPHWRLVFPQVHMASLLHALPAPVRDAMKATNAGDWTKLPLKDLEKRLVEGL